MTPKPDVIRRKLRDLELEIKRAEELREFHNDHVIILRAAIARASDAHTALAAQLPNYKRRKVAK
jgi:hypothetical protein